MLTDPEKVFEADAETYAALLKAQRDTMKTFFQERVCRSAVERRKRSARSTGSLFQQRLREIKEDAATYERAMVCKTILHILVGTWDAFCNHPTAGHGASQAEDEALYARAVKMRKQAAPEAVDKAVAQRRAEEQDSKKWTQQILDWPPITWGTKLESARRIEKWRDLSKRERFANDPGVPRFKGDS